MGKILVHQRFTFLRQALIDTLSKGNGNIMDSLPEVGKLYTVT